MVSPEKNHDGNKSKYSAIKDKSEQIEQPKTALLFWRESGWKSVYPIPGIILMFIHSINSAIGSRFSFAIIRFLNHNHFSIF